MWTCIFFFASAGASSAYLTISEIFPIEVRAIAIAFFFSFGTAVGGFIGPWLYGWLVSTHSRIYLFAGYLLGSGIMCVGGLVGAIWGINAEMKSLEDITDPISKYKPS
mmetsp:Transcript_6739/g.3780  ORF Transcript_6739/g.3780 Transcript_6739/m.3780 type:complete len:108 (-) Transcript_6739:11-334(-)